MNKEDKLKALDAALTQIEKAYGKGSVMKKKTKLDPLGESEREELIRLRAEYVLLQQRTDSGKNEMDVSRRI